ncbi:hypothetical protein NL676_020945 [Syzygium grande]|nr:hypothetical protein NL676_020945 [Syzygium grande]
MLCFLRVCILHRWVGGLAMENEQRLSVVGGGPASWAWLVQSNGPGCACEFDQLDGPSPMKLRWSGFMDGLESARPV